MKRQGAHISQLLPCLKPLFVSLRCADYYPGLLPHYRYGHCAPCTANMSTKVVHIIALLVLVLYTPLGHSYKPGWVCRSSALLVRPPQALSRTSGKWRASVQVLDARDDRGTTTLSAPSLPDPTETDMRRYAFLLANITDCLDSKPESALSLASQEMGWLLHRNVPK
jgi:hypothetical protein